MTCKNKWSQNSTALSSVDASFAGGAAFAEAASGGRGRDCQIIFCSLRRNLIRKQFAYATADLLRHVVKVSYGPNSLPNLSFVS